MVKCLHENYLGADWDTAHALRPPALARRRAATALKAVPTAQKEGMEFLVANMPDSDLQSLTSKSLLQNVVEAVSHGLAVKDDDFAFGVGMQTVGVGMQTVREV